MVKRLPVVVGVVVGLLPPLALYSDGYWDLQLLLALWFSWTVSGWLLARNRKTMRAAQERWGVLFVVLVVGVARFGIHADLPVSGDLWDALGLLLLGVGSGAMGLGVEMAHSNSEQPEGSSTTAPN